ncbi:hypothetical protein ACHMXK_07120 [Polaromonas sp. UC242_47]
MQLPRAAIDPRLSYALRATITLGSESPIAAFENKVLDMLATTTGQHIDRQQLSLLGGSQVLARFEAVYL